MLAPIVAPEVISVIPDQRSINVSWMKLFCQDRLGYTTMYEVRYSIFGDSVNLTLNTTYGNETSLQIDGLEEFTNYTIEVRAYTSVGPGPYSDPVNVQTLEDCKYIYCVPSVWLCICLCCTYVNNLCVCACKYKCHITYRYIAVVFVCLNFNKCSS